jgi:squalene synthase HpnC
VPSSLPPPVAPAGAPTLAPPVSHYENFPVASWLCPPRLRPAIAAIYAFARTADDIADEGDATPAARLADLAAFRADLHAAARGESPSPRWPPVFAPLGRVIATFGLPVPLLDDLLSAFEQDIIKTRDGAGYADRAALLDYCTRSANPVGRLLLHLYGVGEAEALAQSDAICSALQLINFWQDLSVDIPRGRFYLPQDRCAALGVDPGNLEQTLEATELIAENVQWALGLMQKGAPLVKKVPGRAGWELRLVVQGGLRILDKIVALRHATLRTRPRLRAWDLPTMLWRALWM